jgi:hypothetical protein
VIPEGVSEGDRRSLRFCFEAPTLRAAVALATELRTYAPDAVRVRPALRRTLRDNPWMVAITTPPAPLMPAVVALWQRAMSDVAADFQSCRLVESRIGRKR